MASHCPYCGRPDISSAVVVSRHRTADGFATWGRCCCGSMQLRLTGTEGTRVVIRARPAS